MSARVRYLGRDNQGNTFYVYPKPVRHKHRGWPKFREYMAVSDLARLIERWEIWDLNIKDWVSPPPERKK